MEAARVNLARLLRASGQPDAVLILLEQTDRWYRASGGGDGALLARCLLASLFVRNRWCPRRRHGSSGASLGRARPPGRRPR